MANISMEVMDGEVYKSINRELKALTDSHTYTAVPTRVALEAMKELDPGSFTVWLHLYIQSYFKEGEITIQLKDIADGIGMAKSTVESKVKVLIDSGYLKKRQNFDTSKKYETFLASTFFVIAPEHVLIKVKESKTRAQCYKDAGKMLIGTHAEKTDIQVQVHEIANNNVMSEILELDLEKKNIEQAIEALDTRASAGDMNAKMEILAHRIKLKNINEAAQKKFTAQEPHTPSRNSQGASPEIREYNKTITKLDYYNNNNRGVDKAPRGESENKTNISTICSFASQEKKQDSGYSKQPTTLNDDTLMKIKAAIAVSCVSNPDETFREAEFAISRRFTDKTVTHALNVFIKLLKEGRWTTPLPMRNELRQPMSSMAPDSNSPLTGIFKQIFNDEMRSH